MATATLRGAFDIAELKATLQALPTEESQHRIDENRQWVRWLGQPQQIVPLIRQVLGDQALLEEVASRSYRHINLFDKIVLIGNDDPNGYRLTLHLWRPPYTKLEHREELIHEHRFNFWSTILVGTLTSENFELAPDGREMRRYRYVPEVGRARTFHDVYEFCGDVALKERDPGSKPSGEAYYLAAPRIHRIILPEVDTTCTLVLRGPRLREYSFVYNTSYPSYNTRFSNEMFNATELETRLAALFQRLDRGMS